MMITRRQAAFAAALATAFFLVLGGQAMAAPVPDLDAQLLQAAEHGQVEQVRALLQRGAHLEALSASKRTPLMVAASKGQAAVVAELLKAGADPNACPGGYYFVLEVAIPGDSLPVIQALVAAGADARRLKDGGAHLLADSSSHPEIVRALLAAGAQTPIFHDRELIEKIAASGNKGLLESLLHPFEHDNFPGEPLVGALRAHDLSLLQALLRDGIPPNGLTRSLDTPLNAVVGWGDPSMELEAIRLLLAAGADVNLEGNLHKTPLVLAMDYQNAEIAELLIARGAKVNKVPARPGPTALIEAVTFGRLEMMRLLFRHGADPNLRDANGVSPLQRAASGAYKDTVAELLAHGARADAGPGGAQEQDRDPVALAAESCDGAGLAALLKTGVALERISLRRLGNCPPKVIWEVSQAGFDLNRRDTMGETILLGAATHTRLETVVRLLELGADPNLAAPDGETALMRVAANDDRWEMVKALLDHHADPKARDAHGRTALHRAAEVAAWRNISLLAVAGADPEVRDPQGWTPTELYLRKTVGHIAPRIAGAGLRRISFALPIGFRPCEVPRRQPALPVLAECHTGRGGPVLWVSISWAPRGATLASVGPAEGMSTFQAEWEGRPISIGEYAPADALEQVTDPDVWIAVIPVRWNPLLVRVWAPREYGMEAGWILRGILRTFRQPPPLAQFKALGAGRISTLLGCSVALFAVLAAAGIWLFRKVFMKGSRS